MMEMRTWAGVDCACMHDLAAGFAVIGAHRLHAVAQQVQNDLLNLHRDRT